MTSICIIGGSGMLGCSLIPYLRCLGLKVFCLGRKVKSPSDIAVDFSDYKTLDVALDACNPNFIINLAAETDVDACEDDPHLAYIANVQVVERLCKWVLKNNTCHLVQISTDHIYDGIGYNSENNIKIINYYGMSKYAGEIAASSVPSTILRTNFFGKSMCSSRISFSDWAFTSLLKGDRISVFDNVYFSPLSLASLVKYINVVLENPIVGTFNLGSTCGLTKAEFVYIFAESLGLSTENVTRTSFERSNLKAPRPSDMRMNCSKFKAAYKQIELPALQNEILSIREDYQNGY